MNPFSRFTDKFLQPILEKSTGWIVRQATRLGQAIGITAQETEQVLIEQGLGNIAPEVTKIWESVGGSQTAFKYFSTLNPDEIPNTLFFESVDFIPEKYGIIVEYDVLNIEGEVVGRKTSALYYDSPITQQQVHATAREKIKGRSDIVLPEGTQFTILGGLRNPGLGG